jgi:hypothetical protein
VAACTRQHAGRVTLVRSRYDGLRQRRGRSPGIAQTEPVVRGP